MCKEHKIALKTVHDFISQNPVFTFDELQKEIIRKNGILRIAPGYSIKAYVQELIDAQVLEYDFLKGEFKKLRHEELNLVN
jgi:hypothetical protein